jgi:hypothetical protein
VPTRSVRTKPEIRVVTESVDNRLAVEHISDGQLEAEIWCEFDCIAYVFVGDHAEELSARVARARKGEHSWDYVRPLSREELYNLD